MAPWPMKKKSGQRWNSCAEKDLQELRSKVQNEVVFLRSKVGAKAENKVLNAVLLQRVKDALAQKPISSA